MFAVFTAPDRGRAFKVSNLECREDKNGLDDNAGLAADAGLFLPSASIAPPQGCSNGESFVGFISWISGDLA